MKKYIIIIALAVLSSLTACNSLDQYPSNKYTDANYWTNKDNTYNALWRIYAASNSTEYILDYNILSDDAYGTQTTYNMRDISVGNAPNDNGGYSNLWSSSYTALRYIHILKEHLNDTPLTDAEKARVDAEARFFRALIYYRMTVWFGDAPLYKENPTLEQTRTEKRTSATEIRSFIHSELNEIVANLPKNTELGASEQGRITKGAAIALNARMYLYEADYDNAAKECDKLINGTSYGTYGLASDFDKLFSEEYHGSESILTIEFSGTTGNITKSWNPKPYIPGCVGNGGSGAFNYSPTQELSDVFKKLDGTTAADEDYVGRDKRFYTTLVYNGATVKIPAARVCAIGTGSYICYTKPEDEAAQKDPNRVDCFVQGSETRTQTGYYQAKFFVDNTIDVNGNSFLPLMDCRFAEILLTYAECKQKLGQMSAEIWNKTIKPLRERAGFTDAYCAYPSSGDVLEMIRDERRAELALEGKRCIDLRRYAMEKDPNITSTGAVYISSQATAAFQNPSTGKRYTTAGPYRMTFWFAVPNSQVLLNANLGQNPGR